MASRNQDLLQEQINQAIAGSRGPNILNKQRSSTSPYHANVGRDGSCDVIEQIDEQGMQNEPKSIPLPFMNVPANSKVTSHMLLTEDNPSENAPAQESITQNEQEDDRTVLKT